MQNDKRKLFQYKLFWVCSALAIVWAVYSIFSGWIPYFEMKRMPGQESFKECSLDDSACMEENVRTTNKYFEIMAPIFSVVQSKEFANALKHEDGTTCFLVTDPSNEATADEMKTWLNAFGAKRFYDMLPLFMGLRYEFEKKYHQPTPSKAMIEAAAKLKWNHIPLGKTWSDYNFAQRFWEWGSKATPTQPAIPLSQSQNVFSQYVENGYLFQDQNILRLLDAAQMEIANSQRAAR